MQATADGRADYIPIFLSETPLMFRQNIVPLDVAIVQVSSGDHAVHWTEPWLISTAINH
jgi:acyl-CoA hydrolase